MKKLLIGLLLLLLTGCSLTLEENQETEQTTQNKQEAAYMNITPEEAKQLMDTQQDYVILDVRTRQEYEEKHIPGAILIPDSEIGERAEQALPDKNQLILVYCRSGRRSKLASEKLVQLGYTNIREFGGIIDWPYETE